MGKELIKIKHSLLYRLMPMIYYVLFMYLEQIEFVKSITILTERNITKQLVGLTQIGTIYESKYSSQIIYISGNWTDIKMGVKKFNISLTPMLFLKSYKNQDQSVLYTKVVQFGPTYVASYRVCVFCNCQIFYSNGSFINYSFRLQMVQIIYSDSRQQVYFLKISTVLWLPLNMFINGQLNFGYILLSDLARPTMGPISIAPNQGYLIVGFQYFFAGYLRKFNLINKTAYVDIPAPVNKVLNFTWSSDSSLLYCLDPQTFITYQIKMTSAYTKTQIANSYATPGGKIGRDFKYLKSTNQLAILALSNSSQTSKNNLFIILQNLNGSLAVSQQAKTNNPILSVKFSQNKNSSVFSYTYFSSKQLYLQKNFITSYEQIVNQSTSSNNTQDISQQQTPNSLNPPYNITPGTDIIQSTSNNQSNPDNNFNNQANITDNNSNNSANIIDYNPNNQANITDGVNQTVISQNGHSIVINKNGTQATVQGHIIQLSQFLDVKFLINSQYTNKVDKILTLNTIRQANTVPVSRMLFKPFFLIFSSFDDYWLYSYHQRPYEKVLTTYFNQINAIQSQKWSILSFQTLWGQWFGFNTTNIKQFLDNKIVYTNSQFIKMEGNGNGFFLNTLNFFTSNIFIILLFYILGRILFKIFSNYKISIFFRKYSFIIFLPIMILEGNLQYMTYLFGFEMKTLFFNSFLNKFLSAIVLIINFFFIYCGITVFWLIRHYCQKKQKYFFDNYKPNIKGIWFLSIQFGLRNIALGFGHLFINQSRLALGLSTILLIQTSFLLLNIFISLSVMNISIHEKIKQWLFITSIFLRILLIVSMIFSVNIDKYNFQQTGIVTYSNFSPYNMPILIVLSVFMILSVLYQCLTFMSYFFRKKTIKKKKLINERQIELKTTKKNMNYLKLNRQSIFLQQINIDKIKQKINSKIIDKGKQKHLIYQNYNDSRFKMRISANQKPNNNMIYQKSKFLDEYNKVFRFNSKLVRQK